MFLYRAFCVSLSLSIVIPQPIDSDSYQLGMPGTLIYACPTLWQPRQTFPQQEPMLWQDAPQKSSSGNFEKIRFITHQSELWTEREGRCVDLGLCLYWDRGWGA